ncbi:hypothetical protein [Gordonia sp. MP11Mi]|uniref:Uncharacterized protein n=1 Tax=Gordonia sp. MP11Mi TaxID=3022769 RepID=A0AA97CV40_9ACTN
MNDRPLEPSAELNQLSGLVSRFDAARRTAVSIEDLRAFAVVKDARATAGSLPVTEESAAASVHAARVATARAIVVAVDDLDGAALGIPVKPPVGAGHELGVVARRAVVGLRSVPRRAAGELRHVVADRPHSILIRLAITIVVCLGLVAFYEFSGWSNYTAAQLMLYLYSGLIGSVVCTNALCFEAGRTRELLRSGEPLWRILVIKNLTMAGLLLVSAAPVIALLVAGPSQSSLAAVVDQFLVMILVWMGVANVLSVVAPLRQEPLSARLHDGTWLPYLVSFAVSYGVGLTVNLMIFWRLWARQSAGEQMTGGAVSAFILVLVSSVLLWCLLTVFATVCAQNKELRRALDREMVSYGEPARGISDESRSSAPG